MAGLEFARAYLDDLLIISKKSFQEHLIHLEQVFTRLQEAGLKVNATKSKFCETELHHLGYIITRKNIQPSLKKIEAINNIDTPKTRRQLRRFIGMVNYYRDMWPRRAEILAPLSAMTSTKVKWKWTGEHQEAFELMKKIIAKTNTFDIPRL